MTNQKSFSYLALGDSYTIGESVPETGRWSMQLADSLKKQGIILEPIDIIATTGWRTDELKEAMETNTKFDYDLVSLLIGVNNQYQGKSAESYEPEFEELLNLAIERVGGDKNKVFVLSIPDYGFTPFGAEKKDQITKELAVYNQINRRVTEEAGISYYNITPISQRSEEEPDLVADDTLHPSAKQYTMWVEEILLDQAFLNKFKK